MSAAWDWVLDHLPERILRSFDRVPIVVMTRRERYQSEKAAFELGRDYERGALSPTPRPRKPRRHLHAV